MVYNHYIKCQVCGAITRIRLQVGFLEYHPVNVVCGRCGTSLYGSVNIGQINPGLTFKFENADEIINSDEADYVVECSGEFPTLKNHIDSPDNKTCLSPFMRYIGKMGQENYEKFSKVVANLNGFRERWPQYKRIIDLFDKGDRTYLLNEIWKMLPRANFPCRNEFEIARAVHMIEVLYLIGTLRDDVISDLSLSESIMQLDYGQMLSLLTFLNSHEGYSLNKLQSSVYKIYDEFIAVYPFLIPALCLQYCKENSVDFEIEGSTTSSFDSIKQFSLNAYETLGNLLVIPVALNNIKYRSDYNRCEEKDRKTIDLEQFINMRSKANRYHYCYDSEQYTQKLQIRSNSKLRNAIGHNDVEYNAITQQLTYIPDPGNRSKKEHSYLLEFENETIYLFQAITVISEYLYRLREVEMINQGHIPLPLEESYAPVKKVGRNEPCPCGSGLKYKKCHGKQNI